MTEIPANPVLPLKAPLKRPTMQSANRPPLMAGRWAAQGCRG